MRDRVGETAIAALSPRGFTGRFNKEEMMKENNEKLHEEELKDKNAKKAVHEEKTYLTWVNKIGYGSGDIAGNVV